MYDSADTKRLSKELLAGVSQGGGSVQIQCIDSDDTEKTFNRLNVQRHRLQIKDVKINYNLVTFVLSIVLKELKVAMSGKPDNSHMSEKADIPVSPEIRTKRAKRTLLAAAPVEAYREAAEAAGVDPEDLHAFAEESAEAINAMGGLEAANASARPWAEVKAELGLPERVEIDLGEGAVMDQGDLGTAVAISTSIALKATQGIVVDEDAELPPEVVEALLPRVASRSQGRRHAAQSAKPPVDRTDPNDKPSTAPARKTQPAGLPPLNLYEGKRLREKGKCFHCGGECPCAPDRHYHQRVFEEGATRAYAVDICCHCVGHKV